MRTMLMAFLLTALAGPVSLAEEATPAEKKAARKWSNSTELSVVITQGNSNTQTVGFKNTLTRRWQERSRFRLRLDTTISNTADDPYAVVNCGDLDPQTCANNLPSDPQDADYTVVYPPVTRDIGKYFVEGRYDQSLGKKLFWNAGASWYSDFEAGINYRYSAFGGMGHRFWDRDDLKFNLTYGLSYTLRQEETPDPRKDDQFPGFRFDWDYMNLWGKVTTYRNSLTVNLNLTDTQDSAWEMTNSLGVSMSKTLALKVSLQWIYNNIPALEDIDLFLDSGQRVEVGDVDIRKKQLDTVFNTSLVINF